MNSKDLNKLLDSESNEKSKNLRDYLKSYKGMSIDQLKLLKMFETADNIRTIKNCLVFITILVIIGLILCLILGIKGCSTFGA